MQHQRVAPRQAHPAIALLLALALHAAMWLGLHWLAHPYQCAARPHSDSDTTLELALTEGDERAGLQAPEPARPAIAISPRAAGVPRRGRSAPSARQQPLAAAAAETSESAEGVAETGRAPLPAPPSSRSKPPAIDLGLNDGVRRAAMRGGWLELPSPPGRPTDGGLRQGLAALDAERGLARSSAANHAAYEAARHFAPATGIGIFDVSADERGVVLSVVLASAPASEAAWQRVGQELQRLLQDRRLRVPPGARGLVARLRIETGELAQDAPERFRAKRGAALGQAPAGPRELRAESTRSSLEPGQLTPTLGIALAGGGAGGRIRVVLVDEQAL